MKKHLITPFALAFLICAHPLFAKDSSETNLLPSPCCFVGDVTADELVTEEDINAIVDHILGIQSLTPEEAYYADVNGNGTVTAIDLVLIRKYILGFIETFPKCGDLDGDGFLEYGMLVPTEDDDDIILREHILGITPITDPVLFDNADANNSCTLTGYDLVLWKQLELGWVQFLPGCTYDPTPCM